MGDQEDNVVKGRFIDAEDDETPAHSDDDAGYSHSDEPLAEERIPSSQRMSEDTLHEGGVVDTSKLPLVGETPADRGGGTEVPPPPEIPHGGTSSAGSGPRHKRQGVSEADSSPVITLSDAGSNPDAFVMPSQVSLEDAEVIPDDATWDELTRYADLRMREQSHADAARVVWEGGGLILDKGFVFGRTDDPMLQWQYPLDSDEMFANDVFIDEVKSLPFDTEYSEFEQYVERRKRGMTHAAAAFGVFGIRTLSGSEREELHPLTKASPSSARKYLDLRERGASHAEALGEVFGVESKLSSPASSMGVEYLRRVTEDRELTEEQQVVLREMLDEREKMRRDHGRTPPPASDAMSGCPARFVEPGDDDEVIYFCSISPRTDPEHTTHITIRDGDPLMRWDDGDEGAWREPGDTSSQETVTDPVEGEPDEDDPEHVRLAKMPYAIAEQLSEDSNSEEPKTRLEAEKALARMTEVLEELNISNQGDFAKLRRQGADVSAAVIQIVCQQIVEYLFPDGDESVEAERTLFHLKCEVVTRGLLDSAISQLSQQSILQGVPQGGGQYAQGGEVRPRNRKERRRKR